MIRLFTGVLITLVLLPGSYKAIADTSSDGIDYSLSGEGELLVFIHGSNLDRRLWAPQIDYFSNYAKVLTYDLRGLGSSDTATQPYSDAGDLAKLLDEINAQSVSVIGLSAGAQVALDFGAAHPNRVEKLILASPSVNGFTPKVNPPYLTDLISALRKQDFDEANDVILNSSLLNVPDEYEALVNEMVTSSRQWSLSYEFVQQPAEPVLARLDQINIPTLILLGEADFEAISEIGNLLVEKLPMAEIKILDEGRHLLNLSNSQDFNSAVARFVGTDTR